MPEASDKRTVYERMVAIITELPAIGKTQVNAQQHFNFRGHDDVLNALTPLLAKHGVIIVPHVLERVTAQRTTGNNKAMYEVNLHVQFTCHGKAGDSITGSAWGEGTDMGDKSTMKAGTMAFKAFLNQTFAISTAESAVHDADRSTPEETVAAPRREAPTTVMATKEAVDQFLADVDAAGFDATVQTGIVDRLVQDRGGVPAEWLADQVRALGNAKAVRGTA